MSLQGNVLSCVSGYIYTVHCIPGLSLYPLRRYKLQHYKKVYSVSLCVLVVQYATYQLPQGCSFKPSAKSKNSITCPVFIGRYHY